jgi:hypothetical protein
MKKLILVTILLTLGICSYSQSVTVQDKTFNVGDTIQLTTGTLVDGSFMSMLINPIATGGKEHLTANLSGAKTIIRKFKTYKLGLNQTNYAVCKIGIANVWIDLNLAITKKEILF